MKSKTNKLDFLEFANFKNQAKKAYQVKTPYHHHGLNISSFDLLQLYMIAINLQPKVVGITILFRILDVKEVDY